MVHLNFKIYGNIRLSVYMFDYHSPGGGIGRRKGLKIPRGQPRAGSTPALGRFM